MKNFRQTRLRIGVSAIGLFLASPALAQTPPSPAAEAPTTATPPSQPWAHERSDVPADPAVRYGLLANGLRYAILRNETDRNSVVSGKSFSVLLDLVCLRIFKKKKFF